MPTIKLAVINASTVLKDADVNKALPALQAQVHNDFAPAWGVDADLVFVPKGSEPPTGSWWLTILDNSDQAGAQSGRGPIELIQPQENRYEKTRRKSRRHHRR